MIGVIVVIVSTQLQQSVLARVIVYLLIITKIKGLDVLQVWMFWSKIERVPSDIQVEN